MDKGGVGPVFRFDGKKVFRKPALQLSQSDGGEEVWKAPPGDLRRYMKLSLKLEEALGLEEQMAMQRELNELRADNVWTIGLIGELPNLHMVPNSFRNVPTDAAFGWRTRSIGNTAPECFAIAAATEIVNESLSNS